MKKPFCDKCGKEITEVSETHRTNVDTTTDKIYIRTEVSFGIQNSPVSIDLCNPCQRQLLDEAMLNWNI